MSMDFRMTADDFAIFGDQSSTFLRGVPIRSAMRLFGLMVRQRLLSDSLGGFLPQLSPHRFVFGLPTLTFLLPFPALSDSRLRLGGLTVKRKDFGHSVNPISR
jgi:hypothetical protein